MVRIWLKPLIWFVALCFPVFNRPRNVKWIAQNRLQTHSSVFRFRFEPPKIHSKPISISIQRSARTMAFKRKFAKIDYAFFSLFLCNFAGERVAQARTSLLPHISGSNWKHIKTLKRGLFIRCRRMTQECRSGGFDKVFSAKRVWPSQRRMCIPLEALQSIHRVTFPIEDLCDRKLVAL